MLISEQQAERVGQKRTGGERDRHFKVFWYVHRRTKLTAFFVEIISTGQRIWSE